MKLPPARGPRQVDAADKDFYPSIQGIHVAPTGSCSRQEAVGALQWGFDGAVTAHEGSI